MPSPKPTILVKKSDGTSVRMSWDDFELYRKQNAANKTPAFAMASAGKQAKPVEEKIITPKSELPAKIGEEALATTAPVKDIFVDEARYAQTAGDKTQNTRLPEPEAQADGGQAINKTQRFSDRIQNADNRKQMTSDVKSWTKDDNKSLLEESVDGRPPSRLSGYGEAKAASVLPSKRDDLYDLFIKEIRFPIKDGMRGRLESLIVSFVKGIRTEEQVKGYLKRDEAEGGLGLTDAQVEAVIAAIKNVWHLAVKLETKQNSKQTSKEESGYAAAVAVRPEIKSRVSPNLPKIDAKTMMRDVTPPKVEKVEIKKMSVGPVEEIATMNLTNFRQLAPTASQAAQILREKFFTLKKESIVLYLQAMEVWRSCPLYKDYQDLIKRAVSERRKLPEVVNENKGMKWEEFLEIAEIGKMIGS